MTQYKTYLTRLDENHISFHKQSPGTVNQGSIASSPLQHHAGRQRRVQVGVVGRQPCSRIRLDLVQSFREIFLSKKVIEFRKKFYRILRCCKDTLQSEYRKSQVFNWFQVVQLADCWVFRWYRDKISV